MKKIVLILLMSVPIIAQENKQNYADILWDELQEECVNSSNYTVNYCAALGNLYQQAQNNIQELVSNLKNLQNTVEPIELEKLQKELFDKCWNRDLLAKDTHEICTQEIQILKVLAKKHK